MPDKISERIYAEWFIKKMGWDNCELQDHERPDIIATKPGETIGIEVTCLYQEEKSKGGSPVKALEEKRKDWLRQFIECYYERNSISISVDIFVVSGDLNFKPRLLVEELENSIIKENPVDFKFIRFRYQPNNRTIIKIHYCKLPIAPNKYDNWSIGNNHMGYVGSIDSNLVSDKISAKSHKLKGYDRTCDRFILLIVVNRMYGSGMFHENKIFSYNDPTGFDEIYMVYFPYSFARVLHN